MIAAMTTPPARAGPALLTDAGWTRPLAVIAVAAKH
jgi:hypothetical protein